MKEFKSWILVFLSSGFAVYFFDKIVGSKINWDGFGPKLGYWLTYKISLYQILSFLLVFFLIRFLAKKNPRKKPGLLNSAVVEKQKQLQKFDRIETDDFVVKFSVEFDEKGRPFVENFTPFCKKHGNVPLKMVYYGSIDGFKCTYPSCNIALGGEKVRSGIDSYVEHEWEIINEK